MRFPFYSLRTGVLAHLAFLIVSAMLLINVVMVKFSEKDLIEAKLQTGRLLLHAMEQKVGNHITNQHGTWDHLESDPRFKNEINRLLRAGDFSGILLVNRDGAKVLGYGSWGEREREGISICRDTLITKRYSYHFSGSTWGVIWLANERLKVSSPILFDGHFLGAMTIYAELEPLYQKLRKSEKIILIYILLNTIILVLFGIYLLSRIVVRPIHRLLGITEEFKEGEPFPNLVDSSPNEIGQLSRSLNMMLKRLDENKKELKAHISSLEKANQDLRKAQDEIIKTEKLASVGRLAAGVAHEIGNPIGITLGYLELLKDGNLTEEESRDFLKRIESEITRINQIIRQLLDFSRPASGEMEQTGTHDLIMETVNMLKPQPMMAHIKIRPVLQASKDAVRADPNQLKQVFLNVIINAADAMSGDDVSDKDKTAGTLTIETIDMEDSIEIRFADAGFGIPKQELAHVFDPFYTTKDTGTGTGLGLSVCYRIIEGMGGRIKAESTQGEGTTIIIDIPLYHD
ncbi:MAG: HAMP domain-containing protein [Deltaproteobacteria bacterium]|nr:HAMP domain-containing protein [Deltaproteobacteria bacterium]